MHVCITYAWFSLGLEGTCRSPLDNYKSKRRYIKAMVFGDKQLQIIIPSAVTSIVGYILSFNDTLVNIEA